MKIIRNLLSDTAVDVATHAEQACAGLRRRERRSGGLNWVYLDSGGDRTPLVLIHGFGGDKSNWTRMCRHLRGHFRIIVPDLPGFGESQAPVTLRYRVQDHVERLRGFLADQERLQLLTAETKNWREMGAAASADPATVRTNKIARMKASKVAKQRMEALAEKLKKLKRPKETAPDTTPAPSDAVRRALEVAERARAAASAARAGAERRAATATAPRALLLNDAGEEVDEEGNVLEPVARTGAGVRAVSTFKVNAKSSEEKRKLDKLEAFAALQRETAAEAAAENATWADPSVIGRRRGRKAEFQVRRPPRAVLSRMIFIASIDVRVSREGDARFRERRQRHRHPFKAPRPPLRGPIDAGTTGCDTDLFGAARRGFGHLTEPRRAASAHVFLFRHAVFLTHRKLHSVARMLVSRCNFYACHTKGWASESGRPDGRDPFAQATFRFARPSSARFETRLARPSASSRGG